MRASALADRMTARVLRSPASGLVDRALMLLTVRGRRTGREYTFPVQYAEDGAVLWVLPGHPETKTWWRNLVEPARVGLRLRGQDLGGTARAFDGARDSLIVEAGLRAYLDRFPRAARQLGVCPDGGVIDPRLLHETVAHTVLVRVVPFDGRAPAARAVRAARPAPGPVE